MGLIDTQRLRDTKWERPVKDIPVPELAQSGILPTNNGSAATLRVRGLTGNQMFLAAEAKANHDLLKVFRDAFASRDPEQIKAAATRAFNPAQSGETSAETAYRIEVLVMGVINDQGQPYLDYPDAVALAAHFPSTFIAVSSEILALSGEASHPGEV
jgi:hypothetical protein